MPPPLTAPTLGESILLPLIELLLIVVTVPAPVYMPAPLAVAVLDVTTTLFKLSAPVLLIPPPKDDEPFWIVKPDTFTVAPLCTVITVPHPVPSMAVLDAPAPDSVRLRT